MEVYNTTRGAKSPLEPINSMHHALVSWKSIFAGLLIALITDAILMSLGAAIGGASATSMIENANNANGLVTGIGIWTIASIIISLAVGSYFAARISTFVTGRVGAVEGLIIASLFFALMIFSVGSGVGALGKGLGNIVGAIGNGANNIAGNSIVQNTVENAVSGLNLRADPETVVQGISVRLLRGDADGARRYFGAQTGLSQAEVDSRMAALQQQFDETVKTVGANTTRAISAAGLSAFFAMILGVLAAVLGGAFGSRTNLRVPLAATDNNVIVGTQPRTI